MGDDRRLCCPICDDVIGVYETVVVIDHARSHESSLASEPSLGDGEQVVAHRHCAQAAGWDSAGS